MALLRVGSSNCMFFFVHSPVGTYFGIVLSLMVADGMQEVFGFYARGRKNLNISSITSVFCTCWVSGSGTKIREVGVKTKYNRVKKKSSRYMGLYN